MQDGALPMTAITGFGDLLAVDGAPKRKSYTSKDFVEGDWALGINQNARSSVYESRTVAQQVKWQVVPFQNYECLQRLLH